MHRYGSDNGGGARWHPSRAFHMLRGEAIVWLYTMPLLDAIYMIEAELTSSQISINAKTALLQSKFCNEDVVIIVDQRYC